MEKVKDGGIDLAFLPLYEKNRDVVTSPIAADALVIACPHDHPLAGRTNVPLHSLAGESFVDFQQIGHASHRRSGLWGSQSISQDGA